MAWPLWNFTPLRSLKVQTSLFELADQLVASTGFRVRSCWDRHRYSPVWPSMSRPPWSATVTGLISPVGTTMPALMVAPADPAGVEVDEDVVPEVLLPQAARIPPSSGTDMPMTVPRRRKSRREMWPATNSSMMWFSTSPVRLRSLPSSLWSIVIGCLS
jgi:hypothetical protein